MSDAWSCPILRQSDRFVGVMQHCDAGSCPEHAGVVSAGAGGHAVGSLFFRVHHVRSKLACWLSLWLVEVVMLFGGSQGSEEVVLWSAGMMSVRWRVGRMECCGEKKVMMMMEDVRWLGLEVFHEGEREQRLVEILSMF